MESIAASTCPFGGRTPGKKTSLFATYKLTSLLNKTTYFFNDKLPCILKTFKTTYLFYLVFLMEEGRSRQYHYAKSFLCLNCTVSTLPQ